MTRKRVERETKRFTITPSLRRQESGAALLAAPIASWRKSEETFRVFTDNTPASVWGKQQQGRYSQEPIP